MENNNQLTPNNQSPDPVADQPTPLVSASGTVLVSGQQIAPPKVSSKKLIWAGVFLGLGIVIGGITFLWIDKSGGHKTSSKNTAAISARKVAPPLVTAASPATLKPGLYTVGPDKNIVPGLYSLTPGSQQSGNFAISSPAANYSVALDDNSTGAVGDAKVAWAQLATGDKVQISGGNLLAVTFRAVVMTTSAPPALAKLYDNTNVVTDTPHRTNPGKYFITDPNDKNAYILVIDKNYNLKYNQPLNSTGFHAELEDGDQIATINMSTYDMNPE